MADSLKDLTGAVKQIAENSPKIQKDVKDIRDALVGGDIFKLITSISETLDKELQDKKTAKNVTSSTRKIDRSQKALLRNSNSITKMLSQILNKIDKGSGGGLFGRRDERNRVEKEVRIKEKDKKDGRLSRGLDTIKKLSEVKLKDFLLARRKLKLIDKITNKSLKLFKRFKDSKEVDETMGFVDKSVGLAQNLVKLQKDSKKAQKGVQSLEKLFFGNGKKKKGLLALFKELDEHREEIERGKKTIAGLAVTAGSMLVMTLCLAGLAISVVPAMVGTLAFVAITWILSKTFKWLGKGNKQVVQGSIAIAVLCAGLVMFAIGIGKFAKAVKDLKLKDVGLMVASISGVGLAVAGVGLLALPILAGSAALLLIGGSLGILALSLLVWRHFDSSSAIGNVKIAINGLKDALGFGKENKEVAKKTRWERFKEGLLGTALAFFDMGKTFALMASILFAGVTLGLVRFVLKTWDNYNPSKAIGNIGLAISGLKDTLGFKDTDNTGIDKKGLGNKGLETLAGLLDFVDSVFQMGKVFAQLGSILFASLVMLVVKKSIEKWQDYDGVDKAIGNMGLAITSLKTTLGFETRENETLDTEGFKKQGLGVASDILGFASSVLQFGKTFFQMGTILLAVGIMGFVKDKLEDWKGYDAGDSIGNMGKTLGDLKDALGLKDRDNNDSLKDFGKNLLGGIGDILAFGVAIVQFGKVFFQIGAIFLGVGMMNVVRDNLEKWNNYDSSKAIENMKNTMTRLQEALGLINAKPIEEENTTEEKAKWYERIWNGVKSVGKAISTVASGVVNGIKSMAKLSSLVDFTSAMAEIKDLLVPYDNYNPDPATGNIKRAVNALLSAINDGDNGITRSKAFRDSSQNIMKGLNFLKLGFANTDKITKSAPSIDSTVKSINALNMDKAMVMVELFKSFSKIGHKPFNKFSDAVNKFVTSCTELIDSMNKLRESNESEEGATTTTTTQTSGTIAIENTQALATAIAEAIKSLPINVETNISDIRLSVNGETGRRIILSLE